MKRTKNDFLTGPILPALLKFSIPVLLALMLQALYGAVDLWAVGKFGSTADISRGYRFTGYADHNRPCHWTFHGYHSTFRYLCRPQGL